MLKIVMYINITVINEKIKHFLNFEEFRLYIDDPLIPNQCRLECFA